MTTELTGLTANTEYTVRLTAYKATYDNSEPSQSSVQAWVTATPGKVDYDTDDDRLIEIKTLAQLNAVRHDASGVGSKPHADYTSACPDPAALMGCPSECRDYELAPSPYKRGWTSTREPRATARHLYKSGGHLLQFWLRLAPYPSVLRHPGRQPARNQESPH